MVSIIIPYYNVEKHIRRCISSVISQTYSDLEVLLIDDGSNDQSSIIIDKIISAYTGSIKFYHIHQNNNLGQSAARNRGIVESHGEYIYFLDSDDYITNDCIKLLINEARKDENIEMVMGDLTQINKKYDWPSFYIPNPNSKDIILYACSYRIYTMPWNKLIKKDFIVGNSLYFEEGLFHEDDLWSFQVACKLHNFCSIPQKTYYYVVHENSTQTNKSFEFHFINNSLVRLKMIEFVFANNLFSNTLIYHFITDNLLDFVFDGVHNNRKDLAFDYMRKLRMSHFWNVSYNWKNRKSLKHFCFMCSRYLPNKLSISYLILIQHCFSIFHH